MKNRLDSELVKHGLVSTRSQAESYIKLGYVTVNGQTATKPGLFVSEDAKIALNIKDQYVSRAGLKLASVAEALKLNFTDKTVLDVGSSTGGFTDYALQHGAKQVIAVDVGTNQLHPKLRTDKRIELHEQTDIRNFVKGATSHIDMVVVDVSFISLREILPYISQLMSHYSQLVAMVKPQFEAGKAQINKGVIKNDHMRRDILKDFEVWVQKLFVIQGKADSEVPGNKGNREKFYLLNKVG